MVASISYIHAKLLGNIWLNFIGFSPLFFSYLAEVLIGMENFKFMDILDFFFRQETGTSGKLD